MSDKTPIDIAIKHQKQMSSVHPHAIIGTIEDAINEALKNYVTKQQHKEALKNGYCNNCDLGAYDSFEHWYKENHEK